MEGLDDVDGALFSRIPSKQSDIGKLGNPTIGKEVREITDSKTSIHQDDVDGALFSRIPSKQSGIETLSNPTKRKLGRDITDSRKPIHRGSLGRDITDGGLSSKTSSLQDLRTKKSHHKRKSKNAHDESFSLECTIKPEDLSDDEALSSRPCPDDHSDAILGSRVSLTHEIEPEIQPASSSKFYAPPPRESEQNEDSKPDSTQQNNVVVLFYEPDNENTNTAMLPENSNTNAKQSNSQSESNEMYEMQNSKENGTTSNELTPLHSENGNNSKAEERPSTRTHGRPKKGRSSCLKIAKALCFPVISLIIYFWDIASDIHLAVSYRENGDFDLFWITLSCILIPHILMAVVDVSWVWLDRKRDKSSNRCRILLGCLTLGRIVRALTYMRHVYKVKLLPKRVIGMAPDDRYDKRDWHKARARDEKRDCYMLDFINAFLESAPQLFVQLYLYYAFDLELTSLRVLNLLSSWISIAWTYSAYYRCNREALAGKQDVKIVGFVFFFWSVLAALAARFICTTLLLVSFYTWIGAICFVIHFAVMYFWIVCKEKPDLEGTATSTFGRNLYYLFFAYVGIMCFMNLNNTRARCRMTVFYALIYIENIAMAALVVWKCLSKDSGSDKSIHLIVLPVGFVVHVVLLVNYYLFFHPITGRCYKRKDQS